MFNQFDRVVVTTDDFEGLGVPRGAICFIVDLYTSDEFELDYYHEEETGAVGLTFGARSDQIRRFDE
ncbi:hypothetical protein ACFXHA_39515 [Nocardia sp. NPDC059240]|uniref:hypothetical protein n=1 Tax=Nocardia sp. NPDC059240 TaxID=3346786 RepID=UPI0036945E9C